MARSTATLDFSGRVVLVTGGTKGVGRGIAERFLELGATVVITARTDPTEPVAAARPRGRLRRRRRARPRRRPRPLVEPAVEIGGGRLDVVVNNAGGSPPADAATASPRFTEAIVKLNLLAPLHVAQRANAVMQDAARRAARSSTSAASAASGRRPAAPPTARPRPASST